MVGLFITAIAILVFVLIFLDNQRSKRIREEQAEQQPGNTPRSSIYKEIKVEAPEGYEIMEVKIAGINHRRNMKDYVGTFDGQLVAEPNNEYDPNAIVIKYGRKKMGYIPEHQTDQVREFTGGVLPYDCDGIIAEKYDDDGRRYYYGIVVIARPKK